MTRPRASRRAVGEPGRVLACAGAALLAASSVAAQTNFVVDDFEILPFTISQSGAGTVTEILAVPPPAAGHVISTTRRVTCTVFSGSSTASAQLSTAGLQNAVSIAVPANAQVSLEYPLSAAGQDLTVGGTVDRVEMDVRRIGGGAAEVFCGLADAAGGHIDGKSVPNSASFGVVTWSLSAFSSVNLEDITEIVFHFPDPAAYDVREIRLRGTSSMDVTYVIYEEATMTPPVPSPPVEIGMLDTAMNPRFDLDISISQADAGFTPSLQWAWTQVPALGGEALHALLDWTDPAPFEEVQLAFAVDVSSGPGGLVPELYPPDPVHGPEGVTLVFPVQVRDAPEGALVGSSEIWLTIDPGAEQAATAMEFADVTVSSNAWGDGFQVSFLLLPGAAGVETIWPLLETRVWMDWSEHTVTAVADALPVDRGVTVLRALPSVTRAGAEILASRPFGAGASVGIHDVRGRRLAVVRPPAGARVAFWDGRDESGRGLPAGVYFVRLEGVRDGVTRVVKVR